jgi:hypothetical protein
MTTMNNETPIISITPNNLELVKANLSYREINEKLRKYKKQPKYKIKIELSISSNSEEYSYEDELDEMELQKDIEDDT